MSYRVGNVKVRFNDTNKVVILEQCLFIPEFTTNIVSLRQLDSKGIYARLKSGKIETFLDENYKTPLAKAIRKKSLYVLDVSIQTSGLGNSEAAIALYAKDKNSLVNEGVWHKRLGHAGSKALQALGLEGY